MYLLITTFSFVYADQYNFGEGTTGLSFLPAGVGMMIGVLSFGHLQDYLVHRAKKNMQPGDKCKPEVKLTPWVTIPTGLTLPTGLFIYGWTTQLDRTHDRRRHFLDRSDGGHGKFNPTHTKPELPANGSADVCSELSDGLVTEIRRVGVGGGHAPQITNRGTVAARWT